MTVFIFSGTNIYSGINIFSGTIISSGTNIFSGTIIFSGSNIFSWTIIFSGIFSNSNIGYNMLVFIFFVTSLLLSSESDEIN